jgi:hypothetical protein
MNKTSPKIIWLLTAGAFFAFFVFGFTDNLKGPRFYRIYISIIRSAGQSCSGSISDLWLPR